MKKKLQVFVSSTYEDMQEERQAAVESILQASHIPAGMELFASGSESQWRTIQKWIDESDVFMLILGGRYGSIEPNSKKSYIHLEYEYAEKSGKPIFSVVISDKHLDQKTRSMGTKAVEQINGQQLSDFRKQVTAKVCDFFDDCKDIQLSVHKSLKGFSNYNLSGWVKGNEVLDANEILKQVNELRKENATLKEQLQNQLDSASAGNVTLAESLSEDARTILATAAKSDGHILFVRHMGGSTLQVDRQNLISPQNDKRQEARWKAALEELYTSGLLETRTRRIGEEVYSVNHFGYQVYDNIAKK